ncbi:MAG: hypothetical protein Q9218_004502 [Villophora microphyllina]
MSAITTNTPLASHLIHKVKVSGEDPQPPLSKAFERFCNTFHQAEKASFSGLTLNDVFASLEHLDRVHFSSSKVRRLVARLEPFLYFLDRHAKALDSMVQVYPNPSAMIWGFLRVILESTLSFSQYFKKLVDMMESLGGSLSVYQEYERLLSSESQFQETLADVYFETMVFLKKAKFRVSSSKAYGEHSERQKIMEWLSPFDMETILHRESSRRSSATGQWLYAHPAYIDWLQSRQQTLWISGPPGSGKTVLSTTVIEMIRNRLLVDSNQALAFFFCDKADETYQSEATLLGTLIAQIVAQMQQTPENVRDSYQVAKRYGRSVVSSSDRPLEILIELLLSLGNVFIVIDGVDEFKDPVAIGQIIRRLAITTKEVHFLGLSRDSMILSEQLPDTRNIYLSPTLIGEDIRQYLQEELETLPLSDSNLRARLSERLFHDADSMFLWVRLMVEMLRSATSPYEIECMLSDLPEGLDTLYSAILGSLLKEPPRKRLLAKRALQWICCSARPLHWNELQAALAFDSASADFVETMKPFKSALMEMSGSLFEYVPEGDLFRLTHLSVRDFLFNLRDHTNDEEMRQFCPKGDSTHQEIAKACIASQMQCGIQDPLDNDASSFHLLEYSSRFWCQHVCNASYDSQLHCYVDRFLSLSFRRQTWIMRYLFYEPSTFPLQKLIRCEKSLNEWTRKAITHQAQEGSLGWIQDVPDILLSEGDLRDLDRNEKHTDSVAFENHGINRITYFEKLMVIRDLSREYTMVGATSSGEKWLADSLTSQRALYGATHISTAWLLNGLGIIYDQQQKYALSAHTQESALAIQTSALGPNHLEATWTVNELGRVYRHLGDYERSESMHLRALEILRRALQPNDLEIAWTINTLARTYCNQGRYGEALILIDEALTCRIDILGELHPHSIWTLMDKAKCFRAQGYFEQAAALYKKALQGRQVTLGTKHADTLWAMNNYGLALADLGQTNVALSVQQQALNGQKKTLGPNHEHTLWTQKIVNGTTDT